jgi:hypothetical protein
MTDFSIIWHDSNTPLPPLNLRASDLPENAQHWRGVRDPAASLWWVPGSLDAPALAEQHGIAAGQIRPLNVLKQWGSVLGKNLPIANYVLREMEPDSLDTFLPLLDRQIAQVVSRPGCLGSVLAAEPGAPHHLLGITYWEAERSFVQYMDWFAKHSWKYTVNPITVNVPLRLLTRRTETSEPAAPERG